MILRRFHELLFREASGDPALPRPGHSSLAGLEHAQEASRQMMLKLQGAQRFCFSEGASAAAMMLSEKPEQITAAQAQLFSPYPTCWFEMPADTTGRSIGFFWVGDKTRDPHRQGSVWVALYQPGREWPTLVPSVLDLNEPIKVEPGYSKAVDWVVSQGLMTAEGGAALGKQLVEAIPSTTYWLLSAWALLASKGMTVSVPTDYSRLNRQREAKGFYPLLGFATIKLNLDTERVVQAHHAVGTGTAALHPVRAHLRLLPSGRVTIVKAHWRGDPTYGTVHHRYEVSTSDDGVA